MYHPALQGDRCIDEGVTLLVFSPSAGGVESMMRPYDQSLVTTSTWPPLRRCWVGPLCGAASWAM